jgi:hypothetical protein
MSKGSELRTEGQPGQTILSEISVDATFDLDPKLHDNSFLLCIFKTNEDFWLIFSGGMYQWAKMFQGHRVKVKGRIDTID